MLGNNKAMKEQFYYSLKNPEFTQTVMEALAAFKNGLSILITGETGTGKGMLAKYIHKSLFNEAPFIAINGGAICDSLSDSELFGHEKGAFTGAEIQRKGKFELAHTGTLFIDEIGNMPLGIQEKILTIIEEKNLYRIGSEQPIFTDFRLICATNLPLKAGMANSKLRDDLFYRISQYEIEIPPLRSLPEVLEDYIHHFIKQFNNEFETTFTPTAHWLREMKSYSWPGNIRELRNKIQTTVAIFAETQIERPPFGIQMLDSITPIEQKPVIGKGVGLTDIMDRYEIEIIESALNESKTLSKAARLLQIPRSTLQSKIQKFKINFK